jgi:fatty acid desaturase
MTLISDITADARILTSFRLPTDPRARMAARLPAWLQPFLTWLTAKPAPGEVPAGRSAESFVAGALGWILAGCALSLCPFLWPEATLAIWALLPIGLTATCCGLGLFQVVVFHHCSHGTVFSTRERNRQVGRLISALLLFKRFDDYQREHMLHHSPRKLLTEEDEFADFVLGMCSLEPDMPKAELWRRVTTNLVSPAFHARFLQRRLRASLVTGDRAHDWVGRIAWAGAFGAAAASGMLLEFAIVWVLPVTVLLQIATVLRILCEHRFPEPEVMAVRDREFVCHATAGVFPGSAPPELSAATPEGLLQWSLWWVELLTVQLFVRLFVLVGDAPCHDFHHRKPATRRWADYIHARQADLDAGSPGFPTGYFETWGLFRAIDQNLETLSATAPEAIGR